MVGTSTFGQPLLLRDAMQRLFEESVVPVTWRGGTNNTLPVDVYGTPDHFTVRALLPGVLPDNITITYAHNAVAISASVPQPPTPQGETVNWFYRELGTGTFTRTIQFSEPVDGDRIESSFVNGVLTLTLPKAEWAKPKKISVNAQTPELVGSGSET
jgi:HSP20 family protein